MCSACNKKLGRLAEYRIRLEILVGIKFGGCMLLIYFGYSLVPRPHPITLSIFRMGPGNKVMLPTLRTGRGNVTASGNPIDKCAVQVANLNPV